MNRHETQGERPYKSDENILRASTPDLSYPRSKALFIESTEVSSTMDKTSLPQSDQLTEYYSEQSFQIPTNYEFRSFEDTSADDLPSNIQLQISDQPYPGLYADNNISTWHGSSTNYSQPSLATWANNDQKVDTNVPPRSHELFSPSSYHEELSQAHERVMEEDCVKSGEKVPKRNGNDQKGWAPYNHHMTNTGGEISAKVDESLISKTLIDPKPDLETPLKKDRRTYACPFHQSEPAKYSSNNRTFRSCAGPGFPSIHRVKEHVYRTHKDIDRDMVQMRLKKRLRKKRSVTKDFPTNEDQWQELFAVVFPDKQIPSPYYQDNPKIEEAPSSDLADLSNIAQRAEILRGVELKLEKMVTAGGQRFNPKNIMEVFREALETKAKGRNSVQSDMNIQVLDSSSDVQKQQQLPSSSTLQKHLPSFHCSLRSSLEEEDYNDAYF